jgi:hypothetical protein
MKPMQILATLLIATALQFHANAEDAVFRIDRSKPAKVTREEKMLVVRNHLEEIAVPKCKSLIMYTTPDDDGYYCILIGLVEKPTESFRPIIVLGKSTLMDEVEIIGNRILGYSISVKTKDRAVADEWIKRIKDLFFPGR